VATNVTDVSNFANVYYGPDTANPTERPNATASQEGDLYWNTTSNNLFVWTGSAWNPAAFDVGTALFDADIGVTVQGYDATIVVDADIGVTVQGYDATILNDADIGVTVQGYDATLLNDADIGVSVFSTPQIVSTNYSTTSGKFLVVDTAGITITLPATPTAGDYVVIKDGTGAAATSSFTIARNGSNIAASATDLTFNKNYAEITMTYIDGTIGWSV